MEAPFRRGARLSGRRQGTSAVRVVAQTLPRRPKPTKPLTTNSTRLMMRSQMSPSTNRPIPPTRRASNSRMMINALMSLRVPVPRSPKPIAPRPCRDFTRSGDTRSRRRSRALTRRRVGRPSGRGRTGRGRSLRSLVTIPSPRRRIDQQAACIVDDPADRARLITAASSTRQRRVGIRRHLSNPSDALRAPTSASTGTAPR